MFKVNNGLYFNTNLIVKFTTYKLVDGTEKYAITLSDGTRHIILDKETFDNLKEASGTVTYSDVIVTDKLSVGEIDDVEEEINKIKDYSDVKDVVGTYADLMAYDTSTLNLNDVIEVLSDENEDNANTMYKWDGTQFNLIGRLGPFYTKSESDARYPTSIQYDSTNKKITQTKNNLTTDVVTVSILKTDMELNNVVNTGDSDVPVSGGTTKFTTGGAYIELGKKVDKEPGKGLSTNDYVTVDKEYLDNLRTTLPNVNDTTIALTYSQIKALKDANQLIAGRTYRITDYSTMTIDPETRSMGNDFDIILKANTTNSFDPICSAHVGTGTNYFAQNYVSQWILWYNFDNDTSLCSWVDNTCKGYIYRMIDEYNNDLPYDFKNIQFKRYKIASTTYNTYSNLVGMYLGNTSPYGYTIDSNDFVWRYTFVCSDALDEDLSNKHIEVGDHTTCRYVKQIKMGTRLSDSPYRSKLQLNDNVFISGNIICDMTFGNQTHTNTVQVVNDFSYNYFGSMMRKNLIYVTDFNHNNIRECLEDNLIGSGTKMLSWNWIGDHCSSNIIQGMTLVYCLGYLRYVKADSPNETLTNVKLSTTFVGSENYSIWITNAVNDNTSDLSYDEIGTIAGLKLDHSKLYAATMNYIGNASITGRPVRVITSDIITNTDIYFDEDTSAVYEWEFKNSRGSSSNHLIIDFRGSTDVLVINAVKTYEKKIYSINETLTGWSGTFSYKVYDSTNKFEKTYMWSSVMDGLTPTENVILKDLTKHEVVDRVDSNYEIVDNILVNAIDKIDPSKNYTVTNHTDEATYRFTAPANAKLLMLQSIGGNTVKLSPSVASDSTKALIKTMPSTVYDFDVSKVEGNSEVSENLIPLTDIAETTTNGITYSVSDGSVIMNDTATGGFFLYIADNISITLQVGTYSLATFNAIPSSPNGMSIILYSGDNVVASITGGNSTSTFTLNETTIITSIRYWIPSGISFTNYVNKPMLVSGSTAPTTFEPYYSGIHNFQWNGIKVEGANLAGGTIIENQGYAQDDGTYSSNDTNIMSLLEVMPNTTYSKNNGLWINYYDENQTFISQYGGDTFTTPSNCYYVGITIPKTTPNLMLNYGSTALTYVPYIAPTTIPIDLSTILYNGQPLFEGNSLKGVGTAKDYITPYVAHKQMGIVDLSTLNFTYTTDSDKPRWYVNFTSAKIPSSSTTVPNMICNSYEVVSETDGWNNVSGLSITTTSLLVIYGTTQPSGLLVYELATPIEVSIDWSSTLRGIQGYSNGTITLQNTYNMDVESVITYNSIIQETLCPSITITRNGVEVETRNLPTQASDGWSAGNQRNYRVFSDYEGNAVNKRYTNVNKGDMGTPTWNYESENTQFIAQMFAGAKISTIDVLNKDYVGAWTGDKTMYISSSSKIVVRDSYYNDGTIFKIANTGNPLYYELADTSKTETDIDDFDYFFDVEEGDVITFNNTYAQQVYATYSFLIESEDN